MHVFTGLKKYDSQRLLLGIRDNGINETVAHNTNLANQFRIGRSSGSTLTPALRSAPRS